MNIWSSSPLLRVVIPLSFGIFFNSYFFIYSEILILLLSICLLLSVISIIKKRFDYTTHNINIITQTLFFFFAGMILVKKPIIIEEKIKAIGIVEEIKSKSAGTDYWVKIHDQKNNTRKILVKNSDKILKRGYKIALAGYLSEIESAKFPGGFDPKEYHQKMGIFLQSKNTEIIVLDTNVSLNYYIKNKSIEIQKILAENIEKSLGKNKESGFLIALTLGDRSGVDYEIINQFSNTGLIHVLAVSGLHVGIIFGIISFVLNRLKCNKNLSSAISILVLWVFALISGFSPSVIRAAIMFSFLVFGQSIKKKGQSLNFLSASAILQLVIDPAILFQPGFQLSYSAVLGILVFQKSFSGNYRHPNFIMEQIKNMTSVTLSAQLSTLGFCLYHFKQFPVYFLISNLLILPIIPVFLIIGICGTFLHYLPYSDEISEWIINPFTRFLLFSIEQLSHLPESVIYFPNFGYIDFVLISVMIILIKYGIEFGWNYIIKYQIILLILFQLNPIYQSILNKKNYQVYGKKHLINNILIMEKADIFINENQIKKNGIEHVLWIEKASEK